MNITYTNYAIKQKNDIIEYNNSLVSTIESLENVIKNDPTIVISDYKVKYENKKYNLLYRTITVKICTRITISGRLIIYFINLNNNEVRILGFVRDTVK